MQYRLHFLLNNCLFVIFFHLCICHDTSLVFMWLFLRIWLPGSCSVLLAQFLSSMVLLPWFIWRSHFSLFERMVKPAGSTFACSHLTSSHCHPYVTWSSGKGVKLLWILLLVHTNLFTVPQTSWWQTDCTLVRLRCINTSVKFLLPNSRIKLTVTNKQCESGNWFNMYWTLSKNSWTLINNSFVWIW